MTWDKCKKRGWGREREKTENGGGGGGEGVEETCGVSSVCSKGLHCCHLHVHVSHVSFQAKEGTGLTILSRSQVWWSHLTEADGRVCRMLDTISSLVM